MFKRGSIADVAPKVVGNERVRESHSCLVAVSKNSPPKSPHASIFEQPPVSLPKSPDLLVKSESKPSFIVLSTKPSLTIVSLTIFSQTTIIQISTWKLNQF